MTVEKTKAEVTPAPERTEKVNEQQEVERLVNLPEEEFIAEMERLESGEVKEADTSTEKKDDTEAEQDGETGDKEEEKTNEGQYGEIDLSQELTDEQVTKLNPRDRGFYFEMKKERQKRQEIEEQLKQIRYGNEAMLKMMQTQRQPVDQANNQPKSATDIVLAEIEQKEQDGQLITAADLRRLREAEQYDAQMQQRQYERQMQERQAYAQKIERLKQLDENEEQFKKEHQDFDHVFVSFVKPLIKVDQNGQPMDERTRKILTALENDPNPAEYAYKRLATMSEEGRKYFADKQAKKTQEELINKTKQVTSTTAQAAANGGKGGQKRITPEEFSRNIEKYLKLPDHLKDRLCMGETVVVTT